MDPGAAYAIGIATILVVVAAVVLIGAVLQHRQERIAQEPSYPPAGDPRRVVLTIHDAIWHRPSEAAAQVTEAVDALGDEADRIDWNWPEHPPEPVRPYNWKEDERGRFA